MAYYHRRETESAVENRNAVNDALLIATMYIIGLNVEVHIKDGSVYEGILHTASIDNDYAIVLKKVRLLKKAYPDANVVKGSLVDTDTVIVHQQDLVQIVAKGVQFPSKEFTGHVKGDGVQASAGHNQYVDREGKIINPKVSKRNKKHKRQTRSKYLAKREMVVISDTVTLAKKEEDRDVFVDKRQVGDGSLEVQSDTKLQTERTTDDVQGSSLSVAVGEAHSTAGLNIQEDKHIQQTPEGVSSGKSTTLEDQGQERSNSDETACSARTAPNVPIDQINVKESRLRASANSFLSVPQKSSSFDKTAKESMLNPGAKLFSPMLHHRLGTPPVGPNGAGYVYMTDTHTMAPIAFAQQEVDASSFPHPSVPVKFVDYNNVTAGIGGNDMPYVQPMSGQVISRMQPIRYPGQFHNFQTGHAYIPQNPQNVMYGPRVRLHPHPISTDVVQNATGFPPATTHQMLFTKYQANASAQALQMYMTQQIIANGGQQHYEIPQPIFPMLRPFEGPGFSNYPSAKFG